MFKLESGQVNKKTEPEKKTDDKSLAQIFDDLKKEKGEAAARAILDFASSGLPERNIKSLHKSIANVEEAREQALAKLEELEFLEKSPEGFLIADLEKFRESLDRKTYKQLGPVFGGKYLGADSSLKTANILFPGLKVVSREDYEHGEREAKDLFYFPESKADALDVEKIKQARFYLTLHDVMQVGDYSSAQYGQIEDLDFREVILPVLIYHPSHGAGYRDEKGKLFIKDQNTGEYRLISSDYIQKNWGTLGTSVEQGGRPGDNFTYPQLFVRRHLPNLIKTGSLKPEDFTSRTDELKQKLDRPRREIKNKGRVNINGVFHNIGAEYSAGDFQAVQLEEGLGGIIDWKGVIVKTFNLFKQAKELAKPRKDGRLEYYASQELTRPINFDIKNIFPQLPSEKDDDYQARLGQLLSSENLFQNDDNLILEHGISPLEFSLKNQFLIAAFAKKAGQEKFNQFVKEYGQDGLRACLALENDPEMADILLELGDQKDLDAKFAARSSFLKYNEIIGALENFELYLRHNFFSKEEFSPEEMRKLEENFQNRANDFLKKVSEEIKNKKAGQSVSRLEKMRLEIVLLQSFLQYAKEQGEKINLEGLSKVSISRKDIGRDLEREKKEELLAMAGENYAKIFSGNKAAFKDFMEDLKKELQNLSSQETYSLEMDGKLIAFCRAKLMGRGEVYVGSLNVRPDLQNYSLGILFSQKVHQELSKKYSIRAITREDNPANGIYKNLGFVFDENTFEKNGVKYFNIFLKKQVL